MTRFIQNTRLAALFAVGMFIATAMFLVSCGKNDTATVSTPQPQRITVKGFYIGMPKAEVLQAIQNTPGVYHDIDSAANHGWETEGFEPGGGEMPGHNYIETFTEIVGSEDCGPKRMMFFLDNNNKLIYLAWNNGAVDVLFNSANMNGGEFAQQFATAYNIPGFTQRQNPQGYIEWTYTSSDNVVISISPAKVMRIKQGDDQQSIRNSFN